MDQVGQSLHLESETSQHLMDGLAHFVHTCMVPNDLKFTFVLLFMNLTVNLLRQQNDLYLHKSGNRCNNAVIPLHF